MNDPDVCSNCGSRHTEPLQDDEHECYDCGEIYTPGKVQAGDAAASMHFTVCPHCGTHTHRGCKNCLADFIHDGDRFEQAWKEALLLEEAEAEHIKGFKLGNYPEEDILRYARMEVDELRAEPDDVNEMADIMCCLVAYCARKGWSMEKVGQAMRHKLRVRFKDADGIIGPFKEGI